MQKDKVLNNVSFSTKAFEHYPDLKNNPKGLKKTQNGPKQQEFKGQKTKLNKNKGDWKVIEVTLIEILI